MGKKVEVKTNVEEVETGADNMFGGEESIGKIVLDTTPQEMPKVVVTPNPVPQVKQVVVPHQPTEKKELVNCLRNERIIVRFIPKESAMIHNKNHILYGGMAETATRSFVVPRLNSTGAYVNVLTNEEKAYLEHIMGLESGALSIYRRENNFWDDSNEQGIGRVTLHKQDNFLDLSNPSDYIKYKILLANKDKIAPSHQALEERPKATYQFEILSEGDETKSNLSRMDAQMQCYFEFGNVRDNKDTLRTLVELIEKRPIAAQTKLDFLQVKIKNYIDKDPRNFLKLITDKYLPAKVLIKRGIDKGIISWRNNLYYWKSDGSPLCEMGEESTLTNAAKYLTQPKYQELKFALEAKLKEE